MVITVLTLLILVHILLFVGLFTLYLYPKIGIDKPDLRITNPEPELNKQLKDGEMNQDEEPLLSDFLEELKTYKEGVFLDKTISIFYNDWSLNPDYEDDYSERVSIETAKLRDLNSEEFKSYRVAWWDLNAYNPYFVEICVKKNEVKGVVKMVHADDLGDIHVQDKNGRWHLARPIEFSSILRRVKDAWKVLKGDYVAVKFWSEK